MFYFVLFIQMLSTAFAILGVVQLVLMAAYTARGAIGSADAAFKNTLLAAGCAVFLFYTAAAFEGPPSPPTSDQVDQVEVQMVKEAGV